MSRRAAIAKVKIAQKELGLDDDTYRAVIERVTGKRSAADLTDIELGRVLEEFKRQGWKAKPSGARPAPARAAAEHPSARKARALWLSLWQLGVVEDAAETALEAFAKRQLGVDRLAWADQTQTYKLIEALKAWAARHGWKATGDDVFLMKQRLYMAQLDRLELQGHDVSKRRLFAPHYDEPAIEQAIATAGHELRAMGKAA